jgi:hypothetical protein
MTGSTSSEAGVPSCPRGNVCCRTPRGARTLEIDGRLLRSAYVEGVATAPDRRGESPGSWAMPQLMDELRARFALGALWIVSRSTSGSAGSVGRVRRPCATASRYIGPLKDVGIMVLRFGFRRDLDLRAAIACEAL